jgi:hypothetical protein
MLLKMLLADVADPALDVPAAQIAGDRSLFRQRAGAATAVRARPHSSRRCRLGWQS